MESPYRSGFWPKEHELFDKYARIQSEKLFNFLHMGDLKTNDDMPNGSIDTKAPDCILIRPDKTIYYVEVEVKDAKYYHYVPDDGLHILLKKPESFFDKRHIDPAKLLFLTVMLENMDLYRELSDPERIPDSNRILFVPGRHAMESWQRWKDGIWQGKKDIPSSPKWDDLKLDPRKDNFPVKKWTNRNTPEPETFFSTPQKYIVMYEKTDNKWVRKN
jgi:hypothetical protein